ncbi:MAG TPA: ABC transporter permease [Vicinamibacterales bacterium]|nr:ABC transporter permease [Vicinamibacterales bacterium]
MNIRLAFRTLRKTPFVTVVAIISLALGIGATAAIFSLFNQMLLKPVAAPDPWSLVNLSAPGPKPGSQSCSQAGDCSVVFSYPMFRDLEQQQTVFTGLAAHRLFGANLSYKGDTRAADAVYVSGSYFPVLELRPAIGRLLSPADDERIGEGRVVVLSHRYWRTRFNASEAVLNDTIIVNGQPMTIVGVAPAGFDGTTIGARPQIFVPITMREVMQPTIKAFENRRSYWVYVFARLKRGVSIEQARASLGPQYSAIVNEIEAPLQKGLSEETLKRFRAKPITIEEGRRGQSSVITEARAPLTMLLAVTGFVLLIACANIANLLLARAAARSGEMAVRLSIGAKRGSLIRQLLTEALLLAALGGIAGLLVAQWTMVLIRSAMPAEVSEAIGGDLDGTVLAFAAAITLGTGLLFGLFPAIHSSRPNLLGVLKGQTGQPSGARAAQWFRATLATFQIGMSMALLGGAALFTRSLYNVSRVDLGIEGDRVITFSVSPDLNGYTPERSQQFFRRIEEGLSAQPGVTSVAAALVPILSGNSWGNDVMVEGFEAGLDTDRNSRFNAVGPGYFRTLGVPLIAGREFTTSDSLNAPKVAIVNEAFAKKFGLGRQAVGKRMETGRSGKLDMEIVGFVADAKYSDVKDAVPPLYFIPYSQDNTIGSVTFYARTALDPNEFMKTIVPFVRTLDPNLPVENLRSVPQQVRENVFQDRLVTMLSAAFAILATVLAAVGLYGVLAYTVSQRTREFGLRMALGAAPGRVRALVLRQVLVMILIGGTLGLAAAVGLGWSASSILYQLEGYDPVALGASMLVLVLVALGAGFVPAHRASRLEPMRALRYE